jgi:flagellar basal body-associated protein FliL
MADNSDLSINNIRIHLSQLPEKWTQELKDFFIKQPDFNEAIINALSSQVKANLNLNQQLQRLEQRIRKLEGK